MNAGRLRHRVVIHQLTETQSTLGEPVHSYTTGATVWASIEPLQGRELFQAQQFQSLIDTKITVRYSTEVSSLSPKSLVTHSTGSVDYHIEAIINPDERNELLHLLTFRVLT